MNQTIKINNHILTQLELFKLPSETPWQEAIVDFLEEWFNDEDFITVNTSGSTGDPKSYQLLKQSMISSAKMTNAFFGLDETKTALLCLPASYIAGKMMLVRAIVGGFNLICVEPSANPFLELKQVIDFTAITPYQLGIVLAENKHNAQTVETHDRASQAISTRPTSFPKNIIIGGAPVSKQLEIQTPEIPCNFYETYGMTETCSHIAFRKLNEEDAFTVLDGVHILQDDRDCLVISAPHLTEQELITNDIVDLIDDKHFRWLGRADFVINSGGVKIHPEQVEKKLEDIIPFRYFISSIADNYLGEKVVLFIESDTSILNLEVKLKDVLDKFEQPKETFYLPKFICSTNGKVLRGETIKSLNL